MGATTRVSTVYSTVCSGADQRKHQSSASLAFVRGIHRWSANFPHKYPATWKIFSFDDVIMTTNASRGIVKTESAWWWLILHCNCHSDAPLLLRHMGLTAYVGDRRQLAVDIVLKDAHAARMFYGLGHHLIRLNHDDVIKHFPRYWSFVRGIHRSPVNSPPKGQWRGALMFSFVCAWINGWVNNREAGDLRHHPAHYDVSVMKLI